MPSDRGGKLRGKILIHTSAVLGVALVACALLHRRTLGAPDYRTSSLVPAELVLLVLLALILLIQPVLAVVYIARQRWAGLWIVGITTAICAVAWMAALILDAPTLLFAT